MSHGIHLVIRLHSMYNNCYIAKEAGKNMKTGLVLEGGSVRGLYTAGVLDVFMEHGISFDGVIGVSAGCIHGASFMSGQRGRSIRYYLKYCNDPRFMSFSSLLKTGDLVGADFCYHEIPEKLDIYDNEAFLQSGVPFYAVCSNVETGKPEYLQMKDMFQDIEIMRASASMPYVSRMVEINGKKYLDGGCTDSIPVDAFRQMGYGRNVVVLTRDSSYRKKPELRGLAKLMYRSYPAFAKVQAERYLHYNRQVERVMELEKERTVFVIRPSVPLTVGRIEKDLEKVMEIYDLGRKDALCAMDDLQYWLKNE